MSPPPRSPNPAAPQAALARALTSTCPGNLDAEKPVADTTANAEELAALCENAGVKNGVVQDKLFLPGMIKLRRAIESGFFGRILSIRGEFGYWVFDGKTVAPNRPSWNYRKEEGGGIILDMLAHWRYVLDELFGKVKAVSCLGATHIPERVDEDDRQLGKPLSYLAALIFGLILGLHFGFGLLLGLLAGFALLPCLRPWRLEVGEWAKKWLSVAVAVCLVIFGISFVLLGNFMVIEYTQYLTILPICDTYFHDIVERENEHTHGGLFSTNSTILPLGPDCFESQDPGSNPWNGLRGLLIFLVGIGAALLIDVVWDLVFRLMAEYILSVLNIRMQTDYDSARVWVYFPFMWFAFMSYFLLAAIMLPFGPFIDPYLLDLIHWWFEFGATVANTAREIGSAVTDVDQLTHVVGQSVQRVQHALSRGHSDPDDPAGILDDDLHDLNMTRVDDLMQYWRYNHRNANTVRETALVAVLVRLRTDPCAGATS